VVGSTNNYNYVYQYKDHLGNIRISYTVDPADSVLKILEENHYYPFGLQHQSYSAVQQMIKHTGGGITLVPVTGPDDLTYNYRYNGKEQQTELGLNMYDFGARNYDAAIGRWMNVDPLAEKFMDVSPYNYAMNNPLFFTDPDGRSAAPIYDTEGEFLGTDDEGLQGKAIIMDEKDFKQGMSHESALAKSKGAEGLSGEEAMSKFSSHYDSLKDRPDYDGKLTLDEANDWYRNGGGESLYVNLKDIDLSNIYTEDFSKVGETKAFNLFTSSNSINDMRVYGNMTLKLYPDDKVRAYSDVYDFEMHNSKNPLNWPRNAATYIGRKVAGSGTAYDINFTGSKGIKPLHPTIK
jgi:RHS repeat-associated protein